MGRSRHRYGGILVLKSRASAFFALELFVYDLDLLVDYLPGKPVDRHMHPVMLLAFDEEACKSGSVGRIAAALATTSIMRFQVRV